MSLIERLVRCGAVAVCATVLIGPAAAADKPKDGAPGNSGNAPGQEKKADEATTPVVVPATAPPAAAPSPAPAEASKKAPGAEVSKKETAPKPKAESKANREPKPKAEPKANREPKSTSKSGSGSFKETSRGEDLKRGHEHKHTICHATGSGTNPYVRITPSVSGVFHGHLSHQDGRDIIPPFLYKGVWYSKNWDATGQAIFAGGCASAARTTPALERPEKERDHGKVLVCHRTGSASNPYVIVNISRSGWLNGHQGHAGDRLIRENVRPGEKATATDLAFAEAHCRGSAEAAGNPAPLTCGSGTTCVPPSNPSVLAAAQPVTPPAGPPAATTAGAAATAGVAAAPSVAAASEGSTVATASAGATSPGGSQAAAAPQAVAGASREAAPVTPADAAGGEKSGASGGVLGAATALGEAVASETLPFTGLPLWLVVVLAVLIVAAGIGFRRPPTTPRP